MLDAIGAVDNTAFLGKREAADCDAQGLARIETEKDAPGRCFGCHSAFGRLSAEICGGRGGGLKIRVSVVSAPGTVVITSPAPGPAVAPAFVVF
jgi:hypothetical protein